MGFPRARARAARQGIARTRLAQQRGEVWGILQSLDFAHKELGPWLILLRLLIPEVDLFYQAPQQVQLGVVAVQPNELRDSRRGQNAAGVIRALRRGRARRGLVTVANSLVFCLKVFLFRFATRSRIWEKTEHMRDTISSRAGELPQFKATPRVQREFNRGFSLDAHALGELGECPAAAHPADVAGYPCRQGLRPQSTRWRFVFDVR